MNMKVLVFFVATILVAWQCHGSEYEIFPLQMKTGHSSGLHYSTEVKCESWRLGVEGHNLINWKTAPEACEEHIGNYLFSEQFGSDSKLVNQQAYFYARTLNITDKDVFVFSVDMTVLSNLPYYKYHGFGTEPNNATLYDAWVWLGEATTMRETKKMYDKLLDLGIKIIFLTGRTMDKEDVTERNLKSAGFHTWEKLILKDPFLYGGKNALQYKSAERKKLEKEGYRIIGNIGDQWSDILGANKGHRTFKLPNPMYYIN